MTAGDEAGTASSAISAASVVVAAAAAEEAAVVVVVVMVVVMVVPEVLMGAEVVESADAAGGASTTIALASPRAVPPCGGAVPDCGTGLTQRSVVSWLHRHHCEGETSVRGEARVDIVLPTPLGNGRRYRPG